MIARLLEGVPRRALLLLGVLLVALIVAPLIASDYLLTVLILILYFAYIGQAWNIMMGFAGQLSLELRSTWDWAYGVRSALRHQPLDRAGASTPSAAAGGDRLLAFLRRFRRLLRILTSPFEFAHRLRPLALGQGSSGFPAGRQLRPNDL
jgi:hypothetical protein